MSNKPKGRFGGRIFYGALALCACALGMTGYFYSASTAGTEPVAVTDAPVIGQELPVSVRNPEQPTDFQPVTRPPETKPAETQPPKPQKLSVCRPVEGETLSGYAAECLSYNETTRDWRTHAGLDIGAEPGTAVVAAAAGEVYTVYDDEQMGTTVVIRHDLGYTTRYASLDPETAVKPGQKVAMGQKLGCVGRSALMESALGDHVHFSVTKDDAPVDPEQFLAQ